MKCKNTFLTGILLSSTALSSYAAEELSPKTASSLIPFERITLNGRFNSISDASEAISKQADKKGAVSYYIQGISDTNHAGGNWRVTADLYKNDAATAGSLPRDRMSNGIRELPGNEAYESEPFDTVSVSGFFRSQPDINDAISSAAKKKGAASFFIVRQVDVNDGGNQHITAYVYHENAAKRRVQKPDLIPANSEAGKAALKAGGHSAKQVEIPGVASSETPVSKFGRFFETTSSTGKRYTVKLPDGIAVQELNDATAAQMQPYDSVSFTGHYSTPTEVSYEVARRAAKKGAKYYHITRQWENQSGGNLTVNADLFR